MSVEAAIRDVVLEAVAPLLARIEDARVHDTLISQAEAARRCGFSPRHLKNLEDEGSFPRRHKRNGNPHYSAWKVDRFIRELPWD